MIFNLMKFFTITIIYILIAAVFNLKNSSICNNIDMGDNGDLYQLFQFQNTEEAIKNFFKRLDIDYTTDTPIVFILPPMSCPRCEGLINPIIGYLKKFKLPSDIILIAIYNNKKAVEKYLKKMSFNVDYVTITDDSFLEYFYLSSKTLKVPFITKFNTITGKLVNSKSLLGFTVDSSNIFNFIKSKELAFVKKSSAQAILDKNDSKITNFNKFSPTIIRKYLKLIDSNDYPLSNILSFDINPSVSLVSVLDELSLNIYIFNLETGELLKTISPDEKEEKKFIDVPENIYRFLKQNNIIKTMYFNNRFLSDSNIIISASLPEVTFKDGNVAYYNKSAYITKNIYNQSDYYIIDYSAHPDNLFSLNHPKAQFIFQDSLIFIPLSKGWPTRGTISLPVELTDLENPFKESFYIYTPQFAIYNFNGEFLNYFGDLDDSYKILKLGYYANSPIIKMDQSNYFVADLYSGKIKIYHNLTDSANVKEYSLVKRNIVKDNNYTKNPLKYITDTFEEVFKYELIDFAIKDSLIHILFKNDLKLTIISVNWYTSKEEVKYLPKILNNMNFHNAILRVVDDAVVIYSLYSKPNEFYYIEQILN